MIRLLSVSRQQMDGLTNRFETETGLVRTNRPYIYGLALVTGRFGPHGSFQPNLLRRFGLMFNQSLSVGLSVFGC